MGSRRLRLTRTRRAVEERAGLRPQEYHVVRGNSAPLEGWLYGRPSPRRGPPLTTQPIVARTTQAEWRRKHPPAFGRKAGMF
jgi:hypothetical protein